MNNIELKLGDVLDELRLVEDETENGAFLKHLYIPRNDRIDELHLKQTNKQARQKL